MNQTGVAISAIEAVQRINEGGWTISGGNRVRDMHFSARPKVTNAFLNVNKLYLETEIGLFTIPSDNIHLLNDGCTISFRETHPTLQERKKAEGGGYKEVQAIRGALVINNQSRLEKLRKEREMQSLRKAEERKLLKQERLATARQKLVVKLTSEFVGKRLTKLDVGNCSIELEFEDGSKLDVEIDGGDCCDAWINVNGISLDTFSETR